MSDMFYNASKEVMYKAKMLRANLTLPEKVLWEKVRKNKLGFKFRRQHPINNYVVDFYCHELRLIIEVDGSNHKSIIDKKSDANRDQFLSDLGLQIIRFENDEVLNRTEHIIQLINDELILRREFLKR